jgi:glycyl-tRNA synthetase beta chain
MSQMVGEFPELQGIMGRYYAAHEGYPEPVVRALDEQYMPRHAGDALPDGAIGQVLSLADRLDTLIGIFAIGQRPSGTKDPFGLRRAALGVLRILIEQRLDLDLEDLLRETADILAEQLGADAKRVKGLAGGTAVPETLDYMLERLKAYYADQGLAADTIDAVLARRPTRPRDFDRRVRAVQAFRALPEAESLAAANKRIRNILRQSEGAAPGAVEPSLLTEAAERALADAMGALSTEVESLFDQGDYEPALSRLAGLRVPVDAFFDEVMVMAEDEALRRNRLALLSELSALFLRAADLSRLQQ